VRGMFYHMAVRFEKKGQKKKGQCQQPEKADYGTILVSAGSGAG
jgi:hypothetical protein